jgi:hypothetical protein
MTLTKEDIISEIASYMHGYLKEGKLSIQPFLTDLSLNIDSLQDLLKIKFLLQDESISFVDKLPDRLRRFKTTTVSNQEVVHGEIKGRILWQESLRERHKRGNNQSVYVTSEQNRSYDTDENLVLKEALVILEQLLYYDDVLSIIERLEWGVQWKALGQIVRTALHKNSYLERVTYQHTTRKQRLRASQHRLPVYREASRLLSNYYRLMRGEYSEDELEEILMATFVMTDNEDTLMELYWTVQLIKERTSTETYFMMIQGKTKVAEWSEGIAVYAVSHNTNGPKDLHFSISFEELESIDHPVIRQLIKSKIWAAKYSEHVFGTHYDRGLWSGRPDILIEKRKQSSGVLDELIIGEVKNTSNKSYAKEGLWELSEYLHLLRTTRKEFARDKLVVKGVLCLGNISIESKQLDELEIKTLEAR